MLFLQFRIGPDSFALCADSIVEIVPLTAMHRARQGGRQGISFDYRGRFIPALDLCQRDLGRPARQRLSTRIVIVRVGGHAGADDLLGLIAENATTMLRIDPDEFAPFAKGPDGLIQRIEVSDLVGQAAA